MQTAPPLTLSDLDHLLASPGEWADLSPERLAEFVFFACMIGGVDTTRQPAVRELYEHASDVLPADVRRAMTRQLAEWVQDLARTHGAAPVTTLSPLLVIDPDDVVVSTAALEAAQLLEPEDGDVLTGPRMMVKVAEDFAEDEERQRAMLAGLTALGDARVFALVHDALPGFAADVVTRLVESIALQPPTEASIAFLVTALERWMAAGQEGYIGVVVAALQRLADVAANASAGPASAGAGVIDLERIFPSWSAEAAGGPVRLRAAYAVPEFGARIAPRLAALSATESYPRLIPAALRAWGADDPPFLAAVRAAVAASGIARGTTAALVNPIAIEPLPDWDRPDWVLEWGIISPFAPAKVRWHVVRVDEATSALVHVRHTPFAPVCRLEAVISSPDTASSSGSSLPGTGRRAARSGLPAVFTTLAERVRPDAPVLAALPHWVSVGEDAGALASVLPHAFRALHAGATVDAAIAALARVKADPRAEIRRQAADAMTEAHRAGDKPDSAPGTGSVAGAQPSPAAEGEYARWLAAASAPDHVAIVAPCFLECWHVAMRLQERRG